jgi:hypothetical protein
MTCLTGTRAVLTTLALPISVALAIGGCQRRTHQDYIPAAVIAREALVRTLDAWQRGEPPGRIAGQPVIQVGDTHRRAGQKLTRYEIAGELPSREGRLFAVRVTFDSPVAEEKIHFVVVGLDPLWVLRQEDYHTMTRWEHNMPDPKAPLESPPPKDES